MDEPKVPVSRRRRSLRLRQYDYAQAGAYFVTICTHRYRALFGEVVEGQMHLNELGELVRQEWFRSTQIRREIQLNAEEFVVMPNHVHGIVWIVEVAETQESDAGGWSTGVAWYGERRAHCRAPLPLVGRPGRSLPAFVAAFKAASARCVNQRRCTPGAAVWQRNYYEHVIRNERDLEAIRQYIVENPRRWHERHSVADLPDPLRRPRFR